MTATLEHGRATGAVHHHSPFPPPPPSWPARHRLTLLWLTPVLLVGGMVNAWGMAHAPQRVDDEGTYVAQAYAVQHFGQLAHYTYWYDHPPLGWLQIAAWTTLTDAFGRHQAAVVAGREAMLVAALVSAGLVWVLVRRTGFSRACAALAAFLFLVSPLAVAYHRMVYLDNVATPWLLAAFVLAAPRRNELASFAGAAVCFAVAVLTKETFLLVLPALAWWMWRNAERSTRRYTMTVATSLFGLLVLGYAVFATLRGELLPGRGHVSLTQGVEFQLFTRKGSGSVLVPHTQASDTIGIWLRYDWVTPLAATLCSVLLMTRAQVRPLALAFLLQLVLLLRPGYLPVPYLVAMIPFGVMAVAMAIELGVRRGAATRLVAVLGGLALALTATPVWAAQLGTLMTVDSDRPMASAEHWVEVHASHHDRVLVDDAVWVDLVRAGFPRSHVVWYYKADTDPSVMRQAPHGWRDYDYVLVTESMRRSLATLGSSPSGEPAPVLSNAFRNSHVVASYGRGNDHVEVRRIGEAPAATAPSSPAAPLVHGARLRPALPRAVGPSAGPSAGSSTSAPDVVPPAEAGTTHHRRHAHRHPPKHRGHHSPAPTPTPAPTSPPTASPSPSADLLGEVLGSLL